MNQIAPDQVHVRRSRQIQLPYAVLAVHLDAGVTMVLDLLDATAECVSITSARSDSYLTYQRLGAALEHRHLDTSQVEHTARIGSEQAEVAVVPKDDRDAFLHSGTSIVWE